MFQVLDCQAKRPSNLRVTTVPITKQIGTGVYTRSMYIYFFFLVVLTVLKSIKVNGKDDIPYMTWKTNMFETTRYLYIDYQYSVSLILIIDIIGYI